MIDSVKALNVGIDIRSEKVCILLYADDVVFLCENEDDLQEMLNTLESWCYTIVIKLILIQKNLKLYILEPNLLHVQIFHLFLMERK